MQRTFKTIGTIASVILWLVGLAAFMFPDMPYSFMLQIAVLLVFNAHVLEVFWYLSWKNRDQSKDLKNVQLIMLIGAFHLMPLYREYKEKHH